MPLTQRVNVAKMSITLTMSYEMSCSNYGLYDPVYWQNNADKWCMKLVKLKLKPINCESGSINNYLSCIVVCQSFSGCQF